MKAIKHTFLILLFLAASVFAQGQNIKWKKKDKRPVVIELFHSPQAFNLPTTQTIKKGNLEYEISHRFLPPISDGYDAYYGLDGPGHIRMALAYAITNNALVSFGRSNASADSGRAEDNIDISLKYKLFQFSKYSKAPVSVALRTGLGWYTNVVGRNKTDRGNFQYYGQVIINTLIVKRMGLGLVPSYLYNSSILDVETQYSLTLGAYAQYYISSGMSALVEWNPTISGFKTGYSPFSFGIELETGGHFFKIFLTNSQMLNSSQFLAGADLGGINDGKWRIGFNITRILSFK